ncbi:transcriptional regulator NrdR [Clostridium sp. MT-14]|uniref:Transcriptional repressor NrdR n=1 Tax=Clostridium aromativorans TaxID=2836848 RepID=A0ABS8N7G1_9CLOT|nr:MULTISPECIES: transcriptional regulator NrdR [Clostridium]KAA8670820.1 transcriptional repressor NrdR [Clostridium sp. HV4-5-A1G]MCC9295744.1 transcriptional regulator NrdR [Clostridium aromativorans]CAB1243459.1 negative regulator of transcription of ribonucleotide reductase nrd genes and operons [Clostridiaceae bacterium BL-3]
MKCPYCGYGESKVVDSRSTDDDMAIRRRRECSNCGKRYTTYEKIENVPLLVIKKDMSREYFDRNKILNGLIKACQKRPVSRKQIEGIADEVEKGINNKMLTEISSSEIGEMIMESLKKVDEVSYVRFASVYRQFKDINTFMEEIKNLISHKED